RLSTLETVLAARIVVQAGDRAVRRNRLRPAMEDRHSRDRCPNHRYQRSDAGLVSVSNRYTSQFPPRLDDSQTSVDRSDFLDWLEGPDEAIKIHKNPTPLFRRLSSWWGSRSPRAHRPTNVRTGRLTYWRFLL